MHLGIIGGGKAGCHLAHHLGRQGGDTLALWSRSEAGRTRLQEAAGKARTADSLEALAGGVDVLLLAVSDDQLPDLARGLTGGPAKLVHLSGVHGLEVYGNEALGCAAVHPPMALGPDAEGVFSSLDQSLWTLQCGLEDQAFFRHFLADRNLAPVLLPVQAARQRAEYHAACVMAANLVHGLMTLAQEGMVRSGVDRKDAPALVKQLVQSVLPAAGTSEGLTGPVKRGDAGTLKRHLLVLGESDPQAAEAYRSLSLVLINLLSKSASQEEREVLENMRSSLTGGEALR